MKLVDGFRFCGPGPRAPRAFQGRCNKETKPAPVPEEGSLSVPLSRTGDRCQSARVDRPGSECETGNRQQE